MTDKEKIVDEAVPEEELKEEEIPEETEEPAEEAEEPAEEATEEEPQEDESARYLRLMADFQNYKRRVEREKSEIHSRAKEGIMTELLVVLDNFERALDHDDGDGFREGMEMILKQLGDVLAKEGLTEIPALGEDFDPNVHNAVMTEDTDDFESGKVSGVMQKGYKLNSKVIRPSMVKVAN